MLWCNKVHAPGALLTCHDRETLGHAGNTLLSNIAGCLANLGGQTGHHLIGLFYLFWSRLDTLSGQLGANGAHVEFLRTVDLFLFEFVPEGIAGLGGAHVAG